MNMSLKRGWVQTAGMPLDEVHSVMRSEIDRVDAVEWIGSACFKLRDRDGRQIGLVQLQGEAASRTDATVEDVLRRALIGQAKPADIAAGDTVIRDLDPRDPGDMAIAATALSSGKAAAIYADDERQNPPPIDLPDFDPYAKGDERNGRSLNWDRVTTIPATEYDEYVRARSAGGKHYGGMLAFCIASSLAAIVGIAAAATYLF